MGKYQVYESCDEPTEYKWWVCTLGCYERFCLGKFKSLKDAEVFCEALNT